VKWRRMSLRHTAGSAATVTPGRALLAGASACCDIVRRELAA
jgi:hypothetical protein